MENKVQRGEAVWPRSSSVAKVKQLMNTVQGRGAGGETGQEGAREGPEAAAEGGSVKEATGLLCFSGVPGAASHQGWFTAISRHTPTVTHATQVRLESPDISPGTPGVSPGSATRCTCDLRSLSLSLLICEVGLLGATLPSQVVKYTSPGEPPSQPALIQPPHYPQKNLGGHVHSLHMTLRRTPEGLSAHNPGRAVSLSAW